MTLLHYMGALLVIVLICIISMYSGKQVKSAKEFADGGRKAGAGMVMGAIIGTLVGGASTIGTAQLAFVYGFSAWWFTLGGGIGVLILAVGFAKPFYNSGISTMPQILAREYGNQSSMLAALLNSLGSFLSIVSQILSGIALITAISTLSTPVATVITVILMAFYVIFGGTLGAGYVGIAKTIIMYISVGICGVMAVIMAGGIGTFLNSPVLPHGQYFNIFARGISVDLGAGLSLVLGILTTQAYIQAVVSAKTLKLSRIGLLTSAALIPLIGIAGIFVGMYMKLYYPTIEARMALPLFILDKMPPLVAGAMLATLLVALVGTGAGLALGISTVFYQDLFKIYSKKNFSDDKALVVTRVAIVAILTFAALMSIGDTGGMILSWSFMSMGLRGSVAFGPLCAAILFSGKIPNQYAIISMIVGPFFTLVGKFILLKSIDPLFLGIACSLLVLLMGYFVGRKQALQIKKDCQS